jgi:hypothetical protein
MLLQFRKINLTLLFTISVFFLFQRGFTEIEAHPAILQGAISVREQSQVSKIQSDKIQPGHSVKLSLLIENRGQHPSPATQVYIRYAFAKPLEKDPNSILFETEKVDLPGIEPNDTFEITFNTNHKWPALPDFIRNDWGMREYQAVVDDKVIGTLAITFSAYYYPGIQKEIPQRIQ